MIINPDVVYDERLAVAWQAESRRVNQRPDADHVAGGRALFDRKLADHREALGAAGDVIPPLFAEAAPTEPRIVDWVIDVARNWLLPEPLRRGPSTLLMGRVGTGKTYQIYGCRRAMLELGAPASWTITTAADMNGSLRKFDQHEAGEFQRVDVLALDDLGVETNRSPFADANLYRIINHRYEHMLPTLIATNLDGQHLEQEFDERVVSRLGEMCGEAVELTGRDRRLGDAK
jgi:DNA replication protein DnaC